MMVTWCDVKILLWLKNRNRDIIHMYIYRYVLTSSVRERRTRSAMRNHHRGQQQQADDGEHGKKNKSVWKSRHNNNADI